MLSTIFPYISTTISRKWQHQYSEYQGVAGYVPLSVFVPSALKYSYRIKIDMNIISYPAALLKKRDVNFDSLNALKRFLSSRKNTPLFLITGIITRADCIRINKTLNIHKTEKKIIFKSIYSYYLMYFLPLDY